MLIVNKTKQKEVKIIDLKEGDVFLVAGKNYSFIRIKRGGKSMVVSSIENEKQYKIKIHNIFDLKTVVGKLNEKPIKEKNDKSITVKDVKINENVVIMTGRSNETPVLYTLVDVNEKIKYSHIFKNPVTGKRTKFAGNDSWKVYRLNDILKKIKL